MKNILITLLFIFTINLVNAQKKDQFTKDTERLVEIISETAFEPVIKQFSALVATDKKEAFEKDIKATFPDLYAEMAAIYKEEFTHNEIKDILMFYGTPTGKKLASKTGVLSQKGMDAGQDWGMKIQTLIAKYQ